MAKAESGHFFDRVFKGGIIVPPPQQPTIVVARFVPSTIVTASALSFETLKAQCADWGGRDAVPFDELLAHSWTVMEFLDGLETKLDLSGAFYTRRFPAKCDSEFEAADLLA